MTQLNEYVTFQHIRPFFDMDLSFENHYIVGIVVFMLTMIFCGQVLKCITRALECSEKCCVACLDICTCPCVHYGHKEMLRVMTMAIIYTFSVGQPFLLLIMRQIMSLNDRQPLWTVNFVWDAINRTQFKHQHNNTVHEHSTHPSFVSIDVKEVDAIFIIMPFALSSALSTWSWLGLHHAGYFSSDPIWDTELFKDINMQLYEVCYIVEIWLLILALSILTAEPVYLWYVVCFSSTCVLLVSYLIACSRINVGTEGINIPILTFAILCTVLSVFASQHWSSCTYQAVHAFMLVFLGLLLGFLHLSVRGEASAGLVIFVSHHYLMFFCDLFYYRGQYRCE